MLHEVVWATLGTGCDSACHGSLWRENTVQKSAELNMRMSAVVLLWRDCWTDCTIGKMRLTRCDCSLSFLFSHSCRISMSDGARYRLYVLHAHGPSIA